MANTDREFMQAAANVMEETDSLFAGTHRTTFLLMVLLYQNASKCPEGLVEGIEILSKIIDEAQCEAIEGFYEQEERKEKRRIKDKARRSAKKAIQKAKKGL